MAISLNSGLEAFRQFAQSDVADDQASVMRWNHSTDRLSIEKAKCTASSAARFFNVSENARTANENNNKVRNALIDALKKEFEVDSFERLPASVKTALRGTHARSDAGDFGFDSQGKATSGQPLTKRRISAVVTAVEQEIRDRSQAQVKAHPVTEEVLNERNARENRSSFAEVMLHELTKGDRPLYDRCYDRGSVMKYLSDHFIHLGDGAEEHTFKALVDKFSRTTAGAIGFMRVTDRDEVRELVGAALRKVVQEYNKAHPNSAYYIDGDEPEVNLADDFEVIGAAAPQEEQSVGDVCQDPAMASSPAGVKDSVISTDYECVELDGQAGVSQADFAISNMPKRQAGNPLKAIGRGFMNFCHTVRCIFNHSLWSRRSADDAAFRPNLTAADLKGLPPYNNGAPFVSTNENIGAMLGLKNGVVLKPFPPAPEAIDNIPLEPKDKFNFRLYGSVDGKPKLSDIKQDPSRQDCWFLSSISSLLRAKGPAAITRLIRMDDEEHAIVRLGKDLYRVPLGELCSTGSGVSGVSYSAPWVKLLEMAMAMHLTNHVEVQHGMDYNNPAYGLTSLLGYPYTIAMDVGSPWEEERISENAADPDALLQKFKSLKTRINDGFPVILSSPNGQLGLALSSGISPGHAVALLDVNEDLQVCTVLDPYGRTRNVAFGDLVNFTVQTEPNGDDERMREIEEEVNRPNMPKLGCLPKMDGKVWLSQYEPLRQRNVTASQQDASKITNHNHRIKKSQYNPIHGYEKKFLLDLLDNDGGGNCFIYSAMAGLEDNGANVTEAASLEFRKAMNMSALQLMEAAQSDLAKGLKFSFDEIGNGPFLKAKIIDENGNEDWTNVKDAALQHADGSALRNGAMLDVNQGAFLAHYLRRPVEIYVSPIVGMADADYKSVFNCDLMTGEPLEGEPIRIYYASNGAEGGHFQAIANAVEVVGQA